MRHLLVLLCLMASGYTQDLSSFSPLKDLQKAAKKTPLQLPNSPEIEHPVDEYDYRVGPGDVFSIIIGGNEEESQQLMVSPEGLPQL